MPQAVEWKDPLSGMSGLRFEEFDNIGDIFSGFSRF